MSFLFTLCRSRAALPTFDTSTSFKDIFAHTVHVFGKWKLDWFGRNLADGGESEKSDRVEFFGIIAPVAPNSGAKNLYFCRYTRHRFYLSFTKLGTKKWICQGMNPIETEFWFFHFPKKMIGFEYLSYRVHLSDDKFLGHRFNFILFHSSMK